MPIPGLCQTYRIWLSPQALHCVLRKLTTALALAGLARAVLNCYVGKIVIYPAGLYVIDRW